MSCLICTNRRKDHGTENFGGFVYVLDGFPQHVSVLRVFMRPTNITLFCLYFVSLFPATTPRATTPHTYHYGLSRLCIHPGYHTRAITLHQYTYIGLSHPLLVIRTFVVYLSPASTPPVLLLHHHRAPHATTYSTSAFVFYRYHCKRQPTQNFSKTAPPTWA